MVAIKLNKKVSFLQKPMRFCLRLLNLELRVRKRLKSANQIFCGEVENTVFKFFSEPLVE